jgi:hypothetical protein
MLWNWVKAHPNSTAWLVVAAMGTLLLLAVIGPVVRP